MLREGLSRVTGGSRGSVVGQAVGELVQAAVSEARPAAAATCVTLTRSKPRSANSRIAASAMAVRVRRRSRGPFVIGLSLAHQRRSFARLLTVTVGTGETVVP